MSDDPHDLPDAVKRVAEQHRAGEPVSVASLPPEAREWMARNCWNCGKARQDCECIFP